MGRIRTIKPEFFKHEELFDAELSSRLPLRLAFAGLWTACDREGRFEWKPRTLKTDIMPYDEVDFTAVLEALVSHGFVGRYRAGGKEYGHIPGFSRHQVINTRESASKLPSPSEADESPPEPTGGARVDDASVTGHGPAQGEGKGREGEGEGSEGASAPSGAAGAEADEAVVDFTKEVFDRGVAYLGRAKVPDRQARSIIGKWRGEVGDAEVFSALKDAAREGVTDPVAWITARFAARAEAPVDMRAIAAQAMSDLRAKGIAQ